MLTSAQVEAYITTGGTVTASSWLDTWYVYGFGSYPNDLVDGIFNWYPVNIGGQIVGGVALTDYTLNSYLNIQLLNKVNIETVILIQREDCCPEQVRDTELYVGMDTSTLVACNANPSGSGLYSCGGRAGLHLRLMHTIQQVVIVGEIRAYSLTPTAITEFTTSKSAYNCSPGSENLFIWPNNLRGTPLQPFVTLYTGCREFLSGGNPAYYQVTFNQSRFVQVITLIGTDTNSYANSRNWRLLVLVNGSYTIFGQYESVVDDYGKEIPVGLFTTSFRIERSDGQPLGFFWVGIFSELTECVGTLDWSDSWQTWPELLNAPSTYITRAKLGSYVISHKLTMLDYSVVPSYVTFDATTQTVSITPPADTELLLQMQVIANLSYDSCFKSGRFQYTLNICTVTLVATPATVSLTLELTGQSLTSPLPTITPSTRTITYSLNATVPTFFQVVGTNLIVSNTAISGTYSFGIVVTDSICQVQITISAAVTLYDCQPTGFTLSSASVSLELSSSAQTLSWSQESKNQLCGTYSVTSDTQSTIQISGQNITVLTSTALTKTATLTLTRDSNSSMQISVPLALNVYDCRITAFNLSAASVSFELLSAANTLTWSMNAVDPLCGAYSIISDTQLKISTAPPSTLEVSTSTAETYTATITLTRDTVPAITTTTSLQVTVYDCQPTGFTLSSASVSLELGSSTQTLSWSQDSKNQLCGTYLVTSDSPSTIQISGQNITVLTSTAVTKTATLTLTRDSNPNMHTSVPLVVNVYDCQPVGFTLSLASISLELGSSSQTLSWSQDSNNQLCATYSVTSDTPSTIQISGQSITVLTSTAVTKTTTLTLTRDSNSNMHTSVPLVINVYDCRITAFNLSAASVSFELLSAANTLTWSMNAVDPLCGAYSIISDTQLKILTAPPSTLVVSTSTAETYTTKITLTRDTVPAMTATTSLQVTIQDCQPTGFALSSASVSLELSSSTQTLSWSYDSKNQLCGTYSVTSDSPSTIQISGQSITVLTSTAATKTATLTLTRDSNSNMHTSVPLVVNVYDCQPTGFTLPATGLILELNSQSKTMSWNADAKDSLCGTYQATSDSSLVTVNGSSITVLTKVAGSQQVTLALVRKDNQNMKTTVQLYVKVVDFTMSGLSLAPVANQTQTNSTNLLNKLSTRLNETEGSNKTAESNLTASFNSTALIQNLVKGDVQANETEALADQVFELMSEVQAIEGTAELFKFLPVINPPSKGMKALLRFAEVTIKEVSRNALVTLQFKEPVNLVNQGARIDSGLLQVVYQKNSEEDVRMIKWELASYSETQIQLQLTFSEPLLISAGVDKDIVQVSLSKVLLLPLNNPFSFEPLRRNLQQTQQRVVLMAEIPVLVRSESDFVKLDSAQKTIKKSTTATVVLPMVAQVALKGAMKKLWFFFNTMQLADTFTEFNNVKAPANVEMISSAYKDIIHVQMMPPQVMDQIKAHLGLKTNSTNTTVSHRLLLAAPTNRSIFILRVALGGLGGCLLAGLVTIIICRNRIWDRLSRSMQKRLRSIYHRVFWNMFIRALLEMFYPMMLLSLKALNESEKPRRELIQIGKVIVFSVFLLFTFIFMIEKREEVDTEAFKEKYGAYLTNVETYLKPAAVHYPAVFMSRRLFIALTITFLRFNLVTQVLCGVHSSLFMLSWLVLVKPFDSPFKNYLECTNEAIVLVLSYFGFLFSDYVDSPVFRYSFGFIYIGLIALGLSINVLGMIMQTISDLIKVYRRWRQKKSVQTQQAASLPLSEPQLPSRPDPAFQRKQSESKSDQSSSSEEDSEYDSEVEIPSQNELLQVPQPATDQKIPNSIGRGRFNQLETVTVKQVRDNNQLQQTSSLESNSTAKMQDGETMGDQVAQTKQYQWPWFRHKLNEQPAKIDDVFGGSLQHKQIESDDSSSQIKSGKAQPQITGQQYAQRNAKVITSPEVAPKRRFFSPSAQRTQFPNQRRRCVNLDEDIKIVDQQIQETINQAESLRNAHLHDGKKFTKVRIQLRKDPSATVSELLSQIREMQERKQQKENEELTDQEVPRHNLKQAQNNNRRGKH